MYFTQETCFLYLSGFLPLFSGVFTKPTSVLSKDLMEENFQAYVKQLPEKNFTGIRSAFQWTFGNTINKTGLHNSMVFEINDSLNGSSQILGQIGIYSNGSEIGVQLSVNSIESSAPGTSFTCSNDFPYWPGSHSCFKSDYGVISNAIYFLDVEIRGKTIRGYISELQKDLTDMDDPYLPRTLIGEIKWHYELENLKPKSYWLMNSFRSCNLLSEITTFNYAPEVYNKQRRVKSSYSSTQEYALCGPQSTLRLTDWSIAIYISRPPPEINETRSMNSLENTGTSHPISLKNATTIFTNV